MKLLSLFFLAVALAALVVFLLRRKQSRARAGHPSSAGSGLVGLPASPLKPSVLRRRSRQRNLLLKLLPARHGTRCRAVAAAQAAEKRLPRLPT